MFSFIACALRSAAKFWIRHDEFEIVYLSHMSFCIVIPMNHQGKVRNQRCPVPCRFSPDFHVFSLLVDDSECWDWDDEAV
ncbi:hypothetical protein BLNAU_9626 [Blattamonas nauphoetae]|uniref:Secreted protein n=1 Tax=Blattamonas nauphoetae TaxID=2049346 RepID=A0ABQ9XV92_9EUKA|nr:hypothetical protein BLNAU_9626 [Blattamonas nauphoetae]